MPDASPPPATSPDDAPPGAVVVRPVLPEREVDRRTLEGCAIVADPSSGVLTFWSDSSRTRKKGPQTAWLASAGRPAEETVTGVVAVTYRHGDVVNGSDRSMLLFTTADGHSLLRGREHLPGLFAPLWPPVLGQLEAAGLSVRAERLTDLKAVSAAHPGALTGGLSLTTGKGYALLFVGIGVVILVLALIITLLVG